jgi:hypothetical protein
MNRGVYNRVSLRSACGAVRGGAPRHSGEVRIQSQWRQVRSAAVWTGVIAFSGEVVWKVD